MHGQSGASETAKQRGPYTKFTAEQRAVIGSKQHSAA